MKAWSKLIAVTLAGCLSALVAGAHAAEITVVAGGGPLPDVLGTLMPMFEKATGNKVTVNFKGGPAIAEDLKKGAADLVITNAEVVDELAASGDVAGNGKTLLMISKVGIAVKAGAPRPDVSTPDKLKAALMAAKTVGYSQGTSGQHFQTVIQRLGIADAVKAKGVVVQGRPVGAAIASGEARNRRPASRRIAPRGRRRRDRRDAARVAEADSVFRWCRRQGEGRGNRPRAGDVLAVSAGDGRAQAQRHGPALILRPGGGVGPGVSLIGRGGASRT